MQDSWRSIESFSPAYFKTSFKTSYNNWQMGNSQMCGCGTASIRNDILSHNITFTVARSKISTLTFHTFQNFDKKSMDFLFPNLHGASPHHQDPKKDITCLPKNNKYFLLLTGLLAEITIYSVCIFSCSFVFIYSIWKNIACILQNIPNYKE